MRRALAVSALATCLVAGASAPAYADVPTATAPRVLVLHDSGGPYGFLGAEYAIMVANLLGHFSATVDARPVSSYTQGQIDSHDATFYIGSTYDEASWYLPGTARRDAVEVFFADTAASTKPVVWMGFNIWKMDWEWDPAWGAASFEDRFGFGFWGHVDLGFNRVMYKGVDLYKGAVLHVNPGASVDGCLEEPDGVQDCDGMLGFTGVTDPSKATVYAEAYSLDSGIRAPYAIRGDNLWFLGDIPFTYLSEEDRYLAFADLLHDMLGIDHAENHRALLRLEDVGPMTSDTGLREAGRILAKHKAPFGLAVIAKHRDPLREISDVTSLDISRSDNMRILRDFKRAGNDIIQHGTTHQFGTLLNPFNGASGEDFEFYRVTKNLDWSLNFLGPVPGDSPKWATERVLEGRKELEKAKLAPALGFEVPHYTASAVDYAAIAKLYPVNWARVVYYAPGSPGGRFVGQFYPYEIKRDHYGQFVIPENLGNIEPEEWNGYPQTLPQDLIRRAKKALVVRDGFASFFFHPDYDPAFLEPTIKGIKAAGYTFVRPCSVPGRC